MGDFDAVQRLCQDLGAKASTRITIVLLSGRVVGDSQEDPSSMDNHGDRPEIIQALAGETGSSVRFSYTLNIDMAYVAIPLRSMATSGPATIVGAVRTSVPLTSIQHELRKIYLRIAAGSLVVAVLTAVRRDDCLTPHQPPSRTDQEGC